MAVETAVPGSCPLTDSTSEGKAGRLPPGDPCTVSSQAPGARTQRPLNALFVWLLTAGLGSGVRRKS